MPRDNRSRALAVAVLAGVALYPMRAAARLHCPSSSYCFHTGMPLYNQGNPNFAFVERPSNIYSQWWSNWHDAAHSSLDWGYPQLPNGTAVVSAKGPFTCDASATQPCNSPSPQLPIVGFIPDGQSHPPVPLSKYVTGNQTFLLTWKRLKELSGSIPASLPYFDSYLPFGPVSPLDDGYAGWSWTALCGPTSGSMAFMAAINERGPNTHVGGWTQTSFVQAQKPSTQSELPDPLHVDHLFANHAFTDPLSSHHFASQQPMTRDEIQRVINYTILEGGWGGGGGMKDQVNDFTIPGRPGAAAVAGGQHSIDAASVIEHISSGDVIVYGFGTYTVGVANPSSFKQTVTLTHRQGGHVETINGFYVAVEGDGSKRYWVEIYNPAYASVEWHELHRLTNKPMQAAVPNPGHKTNPKEPLIMAATQTIDFTAPGSPQPQTDPQGVQYVGYFSDGEYVGTSQYEGMNGLPWYEGGALDGSSANSAAHRGLVDGQTINIIDGVDWMRVE